MTRHRIQKTRQKASIRSSGGSDEPDGTPAPDDGSEARRRARTASEKAAEFLARTERA